MRNGIARGTASAVPETFPLIGTVKDPALFRDNRSLALAYEVAPVDGGGVAILWFGRVVQMDALPVNVGGLEEADYPAEAWSFTEVLDSDLTRHWRPLPLRFWTISFNDMMVQVLFQTVRLALWDKAAEDPGAALIGFLARPPG